MRGSGRLGLWPGQSPPKYPLYLPPESRDPTGHMSLILASTYGFLVSQ